jgi:uncharacterized OsmC-like protein
MAELPQFTFTMEQKQDMQFLVKFDSDEIDDLLLDEPEPIGTGKGPNASRILGAAVANCLSASLLFCLRKARQEPTGIKATITGSMTRTDKGVLLGSGLIAGEGLVGVAVAIYGVKMGAKPGGFLFPWSSEPGFTIAAAAAFILLGWFFVRMTKPSKSEAAS